MTPDHVPCRHCAEPISWDEICWTHDSTGFADCGLLISTVGLVTLNPTPIDTRGDGARAQPEGDWQ